MDLLERCTAEGLPVTVTPARLGEQLLRLSLPFPAGYLAEGMGLQVTGEGARSAAAVRVLTWHPSEGNAPRTARRALVTCPVRFGAGGAHCLVLRATEAQEFPATPFSTEVGWEDDALAVRRHGEPWLHLRLLAPPHGASAPITWETVEENPFYVWQRLTIADAAWPRRIEVRMDCLGTVVAVAHLQRCGVGDGWMPDLGWDLETAAAEARLVGDGAEAAGPQGTTHSFAGGSPCRLEWQGAERWRVEHPAAPHKRRGQLEVSLHDGQLAYRYWRGHQSDRIPMQERAWRRAEIVVAPEHLAPLTPTLQSSHVWQVDPHYWDHLYDTGSTLDADGVLQRSLEYHHRAIVRSAAVGDDWGNVTAYSDDSPHGAVMGMNRLNHGVPIFEEGYRSGDARLLETAVAWCDNFHDLSIWWGEPGHGGTRYNNIRAMQRTPPDDDTHFMWRSNSAVDFCTKGFDALFMAYEQTGDPRMAEALGAQTDYARQSVRADTDRGTTRNAGIARDFLRLYRYTGEESYLAEARRLYRELRTKLADNLLFAESGRPLVSDLPFIEQDATGYRFPFAKPYILGYALESLPFLASAASDEPQLAEVIRALADYMAASQDPLGGWRYPHPRSSYTIMSQAIEHAWQLALAGRALGDHDPWLDAIERVLRQRIHAWRTTGRIYGGHSGWERACGVAADADALEALYERPGDRDPTRDYGEGLPEFGGSPPEGLVYYPEVLRYYAGRRNLADLLRPPRADEPLAKVLDRWVKQNDG